MNKKELEIIRKTVENTINSKNSSGSYNEAWCDGYRYMANSFFDISWNNETKKWEVK